MQASSAQVTLFESNYLKVIFIEFNSEIIYFVKPFTTEVEQPVAVETVQPAFTRVKIPKMQK